jgi:outer membrane protein TolC
MKKLTFLLLVSLAFNATGQEVFTLDKAKQYALEHHADVTNAKIDEAIMDAKVWETTAIGLPQVEASGEFQNFIDIPTSVLPANAFNPMAPEGELVGIQFGTNYNVTGGVSVSQLVFSGNYLVGLQAIKAAAKIQTQATEKTEIDVEMGVAEAFYTVLVLRENQILLAENLEQMKSILEKTRLLVEEEVMISTDAAQLELSVLQVENAIKTIQLQEQSAKNFLKFQMGYPIEKALDVEGSISREVAEFTGSINPENNIDFRILTSQLELNELNLKNTKANYLPTLAAFFNYQQQALRNDFDFFDGDKEWYPTTLWGLQLKIPIFSSGQRSAQVKQAQLEVEKSENQLEMVQEGLKLQIAQAFSEYQIALDKLALSVKSKELAEKVLADSEVLYEEKVITSIELTQAQTQVLNETTNYTNALFELVQAKLALEKLAK